MSAEQNGYAAGQNGLPPPPDPENWTWKTLVTFLHRAPPGAVAEFAFRCAKRVGLIGKMARGPEGSNPAAAAAAAAEAALAGDDPDPAGFGSSAEAAAAACGYAMSAANAVAARDAQLLRRAVGLDFRTLHKLAALPGREEPSEPGRAVEAENVFGPLWPDGLPTWADGRGEGYGYHPRHPREYENDPDIGPVGPELRQRLRDARWVEEQFADGLLDEYRGRYIAVADGRVLASGADPQELKAGAAATSHRPAGRIVVRFVDEWEG